MSMSLLHCFVHSRFWLFNPFWQYSRFEKLPLKSLPAALKKRLEKHSSSSKNSARIRVSTNRTEGQIGQLKVAGRRLKGGKLPATGNRSIAVLACAYHLRFPGIEGLGKAFLAFYEKFVDKSAPGSELGEARKYFDSLTAEE